MVVGVPEASIEVQAVMGEQGEVVEPEGRSVSARCSAGASGGVVEVVEEGEAGAREVLAVPEGRDVGVEGGDAVQGVGLVVEDEALVVGGGVGGFGEVGAEPGGGVHHGLERELVGVWRDGRGGEREGEVAVEGVHRGVALEVGGNGHGFKVGAFLVVFLPPLHRGVCGTTRNAVRLER